MIMYKLNYIIILLLSILVLIYCNDNTTTTIITSSSLLNDTKNCIKAKVGDHVMIEYQVSLKDGSVVMARQKPDQYFHFIIEEAKVYIYI